MIIKKTQFKDLLIVKQKNNRDKRGNLRETFNDKVLKKKFVFEYCTTSKENVFRGFHFQTKNQQAKYVNVIKGKILDVVIDLRKNSKTFGKIFKIILSKDNALGRILSIQKENQGVDPETLELKIDEAILREVPQLEKYHSIIKVFAAVAPLLGLLGTVVGMIVTFQALTLFGTGDPKLMAGGISQALVTTMLGLIVAIPLVFLHSILTSWSTSLIEILEEQSAGLIAKNAGKS